jgi:hypothetical protein
MAKHPGRILKRLSWSVLLSTVEINEFGSLHSRCDDSNAPFTVAAHLALASSSSQNL